MGLRALVTGALLAAAAYLPLATATAQERVAVLTEAGTPVLATEILLAVGPVDEDPDRAGIAYLSARSVLAGIEPVLDQLGARAGVTAHKDALSFSIIAAPDAWEDAIGHALSAIFRDPPDANVVTRERNAIVAQLRGRLANPADAATHELDQAFFGTEHPWGRPTVGTPQTVERLTSTQVGTFVADNFVPGRAYIAVVGPMEEEVVRDHLSLHLPDALPMPVEVVPFEPDILPLRQNYNSITSWVSASYRFPEIVDEEAMRFVAFLADDALSFSPAQRSIYNVWSEVIPRPGGGELRIQVVVPPDEALSWSDRLRELIVSLPALNMHEDIFEAHLRRFRGERIMSLLTPEARAQAAARRLLVPGGDGGVISEIEGLTVERVRAAAASLGEPTLVILGPTPAFD